VVSNCIGLLLSLNMSPHSKLHSLNLVGVVFLVLLAELLTLFRLVLDFPKLFDKLVLNSPIYLIVEHPSRHHSLAQIVSK
jgi:hypothetical protein